VRGRKKKQEIAEDQKQQSYNNNNYYYGHANHIVNYYHNCGMMEEFMEG
jgi:hypothetical protein